MNRTWQRGLATLAVAGFAAHLAWAETLEMVTYYPAPAATSEDLHVRSLTVGTSYNNEAPGDGETLIFDRLGIGTNAPAGPLHVVGADDATSSMIFMQGADTAAAGRPDVRIGLGTETPGALLDISPASTSAAPWFRAGRGGDSGRVWFEYGPQNAPVLVMSDLDNPSRIQFQIMGTGTEAAPQFSSWIGLGRSNAPDLALMGGDVGIGMTNPRTTVDIVTEAPEGSNNVQLTCYNSASVNSAGEFVARRARGTVAAPAAAEVGDDFGGLVMTGYDGTAFRFGSGVNARMEGAPVGTNIPASIQFNTFNGTRYGVRATLSSVGNFGVGGVPTAAAAPNGQVAGNVDVNDLWLRSANGGAGDWLSNLLAAVGGGGGAATGTYVGNGAAGPRSIPPGGLGFQPSFVQIFINGLGYHFEKVRGMPANTSLITTDDPFWRTTYLNITATGFTVGGGGQFETNRNGVTYYYVAYR